MVRDVVVLGLVLVVGPIMIPPPAAGSVSPTSLNLGWGYTRDLGPYNDSFTPIPSLDATWGFGGHWAVHSGITYLRERVLPTTTSIATGRGSFIPLSTGLRFYAGERDDRTRGLFFDAAPAAYPAWIRTAVDDDYRMKVLAGMTLGVGVRFAGVGGSRAELGFKYYASEAAGPHGDVWALREFDPAPSVYRAVRHPGLNVFAAYVAVGLGD